MVLRGFAFPPEVQQAARRQQGGREAEPPGDKARAGEAAGQKREERRRERGEERVDGGAGRAVGDGIARQGQHRQVLGAEQQRRVPRVDAENGQHRVHRVAAAHGHEDREGEGRGRAEKEPEQAEPGGKRAAARSGDAERPRDQRERAEADCLRNEQDRQPRAPAPEEHRHAPDGQRVVQVHAAPVLHVAEQPHAEHHRQQQGHRHGRARQQHLQQRIVAAGQGRREAFRLLRRARGGRREAGVVIGNGILQVDQHDDRQQQNLQERVERGDPGVAFQRLQAGRAEFAEPLRKGCC